MALVAIIGLVHGFDVVEVAHDVGGAEGFAGLGSGRVGWIMGRGVSDERRPVRRTVSSGVAFESSRGRDSSGYRLEK